jgi:hypothetical protein
VLLNHYFVCSRLFPFIIHEWCSLSYLIARWSLLSNCFWVGATEELVLILCIFQGRIQDFKLGGAHLKKLRRAEGGAKMLGVFRVKNNDFTQKNHISSNCGGRREICLGVSCEKSRFYASTDWVIECGTYALYCLHILTTIQTLLLCMDHNLSYSSVSFGHGIHSIYT